jgi:protein-disulfide isomerase
MANLRHAAAVLVWAGFGVLAAAQQAPKIDKAKFAAYVRYAEAFTPNVNVTVDDPVPSVFPGYFRVIVHVTLGPQVLDRTYYVTPDGRHFINGQIWDINDNPFLDTLVRLPKTGPSFGPEDAKVRIVLFSDFECPYCRALAQTIRDNVPKYYPNNVRVIFVDFPLYKHKWARAAAEAAHCVWETSPGAFWPYHDWLFAHQQEITDAASAEKLLESEAVEVAKQHGGDAATISHCIETHAAAAAVNSNVQLGQELGITQTPTFFVNGRMVAGSVDWTTLDTLIKMELNRPKDIPGPPGGSCCEVTIPRVVPK